MSDRLLERKLFSDPRWSRLEFELPGLGHVTNLTGIVKNADTQEDLDVIGVEFRFEEEKRGRESFPHHKPVHHPPCLPAGRQGAIHLKKTPDPFCSLQNPCIVIVTRES
jgi:hypothetical protein